MSGQNAMPFRGLFVALVLLGFSAGESAWALTFNDQQVQVIDHEDFYFENLDNRNRSAFFYQAGANARSLTTQSSGWLEFSGGVLRRNLLLYGGAEASITGGLIQLNVYAYNAPTYWSGGVIEGAIFARSNAQFYVHGTQFEVDGAPVPYGPLVATTGTLSGFLNSGESFSVNFSQAQAPPSNNTGSIILVAGPPTPSPPPDYSHEIALFNDGQSHLVDHADFLNLAYGVHVRSPLQPTTVEIAPGAVIGQRLEFSGSSVVNMTGGEISALAPGSFNALLGENATFNMSGGVVRGTARVERGGQMSLSSGTIDRHLEIAYGSSLDFSEGSVGLHLRCSVAENEIDSSIVMSGGHVGDDLQIWNDCQATLLGGTIAGILDIADGQLEVVGSNFEIDGTPVDFGLVSQGSGVLTGTLASGESIDNFFDLNQPVFQGELMLTVPEPSAFTLLLVGVMGLVGLHSVASARRRPWSTGDRG